MASLIFARTIASPRNLPEPLSAGDTALALPDADLDYAPGDLLFVGESDGEAAEFLGAVASADAEGLTFTLAALAPRPAGATLWTPALELRSPGRLDLPLRRFYEPGARTRRTLGGRVVAVRTARPGARIELAVEGLTPDEEQRLVDWFAVAADGALRPLTLVASTRRLIAMRVDGVLTRLADAGGRRSVAFAAFELGEGRYV
jgi:hypothetical protein